MEGDWPEFMSRLVSVSVREDNAALATDYLRRRGLRPFSGVGYLKVFPVSADRVITDSLVLWNVDVHGGLNSVDVRWEKDKVYRNIWKASGSIPIFNLFNVIREPGGPVVITESVLDAASLIQSTGFNSVVATRGRCSVRHMLFLLPVLHQREVILAFDNDKAGSDMTDKFAKFARDKFERSVRVLNFPSKDLNKCLLDYGEGFMKESIRPQLVQS